MKPIGGAVLLLASAALLSASPARAADSPTRLQHWLERVSSDIDALVDANRLVPPTPIAVEFRARRIWSGELSGDLLDLGVADLGNDGQDELIALTSDSLLVLSRRRGLFDVRVRADLPQTVAPTKSRDAIGMLSIKETQTRIEGAVTTEVLVRARSSEQGAGGVYAWRDGTLELVSEFFGYPLCEAGIVEAAPGRNFFLGSSAVWSSQTGPKLSPNVQQARCSRDLVDPLGNPVRYISDVSLAGTLTVRCEGTDQACTPAAAQFTDVGYAHLVSDVNRDGHPEVVTTQASARSDADRVQVFSQERGERHLIFEREFDRGVMAITAGDFDGDGALELLVAERQARAGRVSLWLLN
tara:strand:+ start:116615 stop:117679 length:1065 start_codon:yes stop_codon:yes gene_type:complete